MATLAERTLRINWSSCGCVVCGCAARGAWPTLAASSCHPMGWAD